MENANLKDSFLFFKKSLKSWKLADKINTKKDWEELWSQLQSQLKKNLSHPIEWTPTVQQKEIAEYVGLDENSLWIKKEFLQSMGSHKIRHLAGAALYQKMSDLQQGSQAFNTKPKAIFSCGNAAMSAAAVAQALNLKLFTFVPAEVSNSVVTTLKKLSAKVVLVPRGSSLGDGDPCQKRFLEAVDKLN